MHLLFLHLHKICSLICKVIRNWCVIIYSVSIFIIAQFQTHQIPKLHNQGHHKHHLLTKLFQPLLYIHHLLKTYQSKQKQSSNTYIILLVHTYAILLCKVFNGFLIARNWKKNQKDVSFNKIFLGKITPVTKNSGKKGHGNVDLRRKISTPKS